jgi:Peptidase family M1 domain
VQACNACVHILLERSMEAACKHAMHACTPLECHLEAEPPPAQEFVLRPVHVRVREACMCACARRACAQVLLERKIVGHVEGAQAEQFHALRGLDGLRATVAGFGNTHPYTRLVPDLRGIDPDDSFSRIPYEKGFYFLYHLQSLVGGPAAFAPFAKAYLTEFGAGTATTAQFKAAFLKHFAGCDAIKGIDWDTWLFSPGLPLLEP